MSGKSEGARAQEGNLSTRQITSWYSTIEVNGVLEREEEKEEGKHGITESDIRHELELTNSPLKSWKKIIRI